VLAAADPDREVSDQEEFVPAAFDPEDSGPAASRGGVTQWGVPYTVRGPGPAGAAGTAWESGMNPYLARTRCPVEPEGQDPAMAQSTAVQFLRLKMSRR